MRAMLPHLSEPQSIKGWGAFQLLLAQFIEYVELFLRQRVTTAGHRSSGPAQEDGFPTMADIVAVAALLVWLYLIAGRAAFWLCTERDQWRPVRLPAWPRVAAVVPARNEAETIAE